MKLCPTCPGPCTKSRNAREAGTCNDPLVDAIRSITDLLTIQGLICIDMSDVRTVIEGGGRAIFATAEASGPDRVRLATDEVIAKLKAAIVATATA